eukprot:CAMPEP_0119105606 /NCGR_PEP_ID=MMETSP1180-20130426/3520_1 /TAXON_ID=3052 ORGANISM="Chlamydomonas cf sp, Strain CCMP681" /NCGR_SAMPLE_ID=MMETSP1180 /ASSEMBLY_ACC=CAM_ASM_000741 /LENGTH=305 /DNA_ID=CAMNT_0007090699 /DNA_START=29 /DNA_END=942 /DNA_ORIENTATION=-
MEGTAELNQAYDGGEAAQTVDVQQEEQAVQQEEQQTFEQQPDAMVAEPALEEPASVPVEDAAPVEEEAKADDATAEKPATGQPGGPRHDSAFVNGKLFLGGLDLQSTKETVSTYCSKWGEISDIVVMEGRGFGFVTYAVPENAGTFLSQKEHTIDGRKVEAKAAVPRPGHGERGGASQYSAPQASTKMFIGGTGDLDDEQLKTYFAQFGEITDAAIVKHPDGASRGFGFVTYATLDDAAKCTKGAHQVEGRTVEVKPAVPRDTDGGGRGGPARGRGGFNGGSSYGGGGGGYSGGYGGGGGGYGGG